MSPNQIFVRHLVGVVTAIAATTTVALWLGAPSRHRGRELATVHTAALEPRSPAELGARLYETKGCIACHTIDGSPRVGPSFKDSWGSQVVLGEGLTIVFDEAYVRESIVHPQAQARPGYPPSMRSFDGLLTDKEIAALTAYLKTLH